MYICMYIRNGMMEQVASLDSDENEFVKQNLPESQRNEGVDTHRLFIYGFFIHFHHYAGDIKFAASNGQTRGLFWICMHNG